MFYMDAFKASDTAAQSRKTETPRASASAIDIQSVSDIQGKTTSADSEPPVLNPNQVAIMLQCHVKTVLRLAQTGKLPAFRVGKLWRFSRLAILQWIESQAYNHNTVCAA